MPKTPGSAKTGGRKKGTPNKCTDGFNASLEANGVDLLGSILQEAASASSERRISIYLDLLPYVYPKRKAVEYKSGSFANDPLIDLSDDQLAELKFEIEVRLNRHLSNEQLSEQIAELENELNSSK